MMDVISILKQAIEKNGSDLFIVPGSQISIKINGEILPLDDEKIMPEHSLALLNRFMRFESQRYEPSVGTRG
jgi:twitching motility protein PilT